MNYCIAQHDQCENVPLIPTWQTFSSAEMKDRSNQQLLIVDVCGNLPHEQHLNERVRAVIHLKWLSNLLRLVETCEGYVGLQAELLVFARASRTHWDRFFFFFLSFAIYQILTNSQLAKLVCAFTSFIWIVWIYSLFIILFIKFIIFIMARKQVHN